MAVAAHAQKTPSQVSVADLGFMSGHWQGSMDDNRIEEIWGEPSGDSMMGVFKWLEGRKTSMYELLSIEQEPSGPVMRLKHFNRGLIGWEEKQKVWEYPLVEFSQGRARFESADKSTVMIYSLSTPGKLLAVLERTKDGKTSREEFEYNAVK